MFIVQIKLNTVSGKVREREMLSDWIDKENARPK